MLVENSVLETWHFLRLKLVFIRKAFSLSCQDNSFDTAYTAFWGWSNSGMFESKEDD